MTTAHQSALAPRGQVGVGAGTAALSSSLRLPLLAQGHLVTAADVAGATGRPVPEVQQALTRQVDLETDEQGWSSVTA